MKKFFAVTVILLLAFQVYSQYSPPINTDIVRSGIWWDANDIIVPADTGYTVAIKNQTDVQILSTTGVTLRPGFIASIYVGNAGCHSFRAAIQQSLLDVKLVTPDSATHADTLGNITIEKWEKYEIAFKLPAEYEVAVDSFFSHYYVTGGVVDTADLNPFAGDSLEVRVDLVSPTGRHLTKWAFFMREAKWDSIDGESDTLIGDPQNALADYNWHFRFAPDEIGSWFYSISVSTPKWNYPLPFYSFGQYFFTATAPLPDNHGYLKVAGNNQFLKFDDGTPFFGIGENLNGAHAHWHDQSKWPSDCDNHFYRLVFDNFNNTFDEMNSVGANFVRNVFLRNYFGFDRDNLGVYDHFWNSLFICSSPAYGCDAGSDEYGNKQFHLKMLDSLFDKARENGIYLEFLVDYEMPAHAYQSFFWGDNAYVRYLESIGHGNIDSIGLYYFSDQTLRYYFKRKYKYFLSRYGYSVNLGLIQPLNEVEIALGFKDSNIGTSNCPPDTSTTIYYLEGVKDSINSWLTDIVGYIKAPVSAGGIGDTNHLYEITYLGIQNVDTTDLGSFSNYYSLYNNSKMDVIGVSSYFDHQAMMTTRTNIAKNITESFPQKPFHVAEGSSFGKITIPGSTPQTAHRYNNYDVTFHNEIWASAFMGGFTTLNTWIGEVVHRWKYATKESLGGTFQMDVHDSVPPFSNIQIDDTIKSYYHNFMRLSEFTSLIDFSQNYIPCIYYGDSMNNIESYYLKSTDTAKAYGWVHNINKYWENAYYYFDGILPYEDYYGCDTMPQPDTLFQLPGFKQNHTYYIYFFWTRLGGQAVPAADTVISDSLGNLPIDLSSSLLGCDSTNADYAFMISESPWNQQRLALHRMEQQADKFDVRISPNPTYGILKVLITGEEEINMRAVEVLDLSGKIILKRDFQGNGVSLNLSDKPKGIYFLKIQSSKSFIVKKIILL